MQYITVPKITLEQRDSFAAAIQAIDTQATHLTAVFTDLLAWLHAGTTRTAIRKGNAADLMPKFACDAKGNAAYARVHDNEGTLVAVDGYKAAVILPAGAEEWDMSNAYLTDAVGVHKSVIQDIFENCRSRIKGEANADALRELLNACAAHKDEHRRKLIEQGLKPSRSGPLGICIEAGKMEAISTAQAAELFHANNGHPMGFNAEFLGTVLRFILCAGSDRIELYYSNYMYPLHFHAGNLYAVILPLRMQW